MVARGSGSGSGSSSSRDRKSAGKIERRLEDFLSGEEDEEGELPFHAEVEDAAAIQSNKHARHSPPRKPRSTFYEEVGEDDFIFNRVNRLPSSSNNADLSKARVPGAKGPPPSRNHERGGTQMDVTSTAAIASSSKAGQGNNISTGRKSSATVKATRRTSLLTNGNPAYPHPHIPDGDLYRHCSADLMPQERMRHVASWTLERSRNELKKDSGLVPAKCRVPLMTALKSTLNDINKGLLQIDWSQGQTGRAKNQVNDSSSSPSGKAKRRKLEPHPRNEANWKAEVEVVKIVKDMQTEKRAWKEAEAELEAFEAETNRLKEEQDQGIDEADVDSGVTFLDDGVEYNAVNRKWMLHARRVLAMEENWATGSSHGEAIILKASEHLQKGRGGQAFEQPGTELDPRWRDVEFKTDLLRSKAHSFAQLSALSQRYITAVSARGARAIQELTQGTEPEQNSSSSSSNSSTNNNQARANLERILSSIRAIEDEVGDEDDEENHRDSEGRIGDTSDGDILRALAGLG